MEYEMIPTENNSLDCCPEEVKNFLLKQHDKLTIKQMRSIITYLNDKILKLTDGVEESVTIEEFEKIKKQDVDSDGEEGEI